MEGGSQIERDTFESTILAVMPVFGFREYSDERGYGIDKTGCRGLGPSNSL